jgi:hypothetical protein
MRYIYSVPAWVEIKTKVVAMNVMTGLILPLLALFVGSVALAEEPTDYRFPRECAMTPAGYPVPLCGKPLTKTPVVIKKEGAALKKYPEHFIPDRRHMKSNNWQAELVEYLAHLVGHSRRRIYGIASAGFRLSSV